eukprot:21158-Heterococcus_DN1.PRE.1
MSAPARRSTRTAAKAAAALAATDPAKCLKAADELCAKATTAADHKAGPAKASPDEPADDEPFCCSICFEEPKLKGVLKCDHEFCFDCVLLWSKTENTCPLCKERFTSITQRSCEAAPAAAAEEEESSGSGTKRKRSTKSGKGKSKKAKAEKVVKVPNKDQAEQFATLHTFITTGPPAALLQQLVAAQLGLGAGQHVPAHLLQNMLNVDIDFERLYSSDDDDDEEEDSRPRSRTVPPGLHVSMPVSSSSVPRRAVPVRGAFYVARGRGAGGSSDSSSSAARAAGPTAEEREALRSVMSQMSASLATLVSAEGGGSSSSSSAPRFTFSLPAAAAAGSGSSRTGAAAAAAAAAGGSQGLTV